MRSKGAVLRSNRRFPHTFSTSSRISNTACDLLSRKYSVLSVSFVVTCVVFAASQHAFRSFPATRVILETRPIFANSSGMNTCKIIGLKVPVESTLTKIGGGGGGATRSRQFPASAREKRRCTFVPPASCRPLPQAHTRTRGAAIAAPHATMGVGPPSVLADSPRQNND